jgi:hypothetical protein
LEHLLRYAGRAAIAASRLSRLPDGRVCYELKRRWKDGTTHVVMTPEVRIERLLAQVAAAEAAPGDVSRGVGAGGWAAFAGGAAVG